MRANGELNEAEANEAEQSKRAAGRAQVQAAEERIPFLLRVPAKVRFLSIEPMLGEINFRWKTYANEATGENYREYLERNGEVNEYESLKGIHQVIVGSESGPNARPMHPDWPRSIRDQCKAAGVPFLFKQWGSFHDGSISGAKQYAVLNDGTYCDFTKEACDELAKKHDGNWGKFNPSLMSRVPKKAACRLLDGKLHDEYPEVNG